MGDEIVVLVTTSVSGEALTIARILVEEHLVACVNVVPAVTSIFFWEGKVQEASESLLICKSRLSIMDRLVARVKELHSYTVPEIVALPVSAGLPEYLRWVSESTAG
jgi:periplasmic divalent cation tolerance protein